MQSSINCLDTTQRCRKIGFISDWNNKYMCKYRFDIFNAFRTCIYTCNNFIIIYIADHISIFVDTHVKNRYNSRIEHEDKKKNENVCDKKNLRFKLRWRESCTIVQSNTEISHRFIRVRFGRNFRHTLIKFGKTWSNLSCSLIMAEAMYDVKKCRSICCHKSLSERLVSQSPFWGCCCCCS